MSQKMPTAAKLAKLVRQSIEERSGRRISQSLVIKKEYATMLVKIAQWVKAGDRDSLINRLEDHGYRDVVEQI